jgi:molybdopterin synthase catalytic subunit
MRFRFTEVAIDTQAARRDLLDRGAGGYVSFEGWVRDHNEGQDVTRLEYEAFQALAVKEGERILTEALQRFPSSTRRASIGWGRSIFPTWPYG